MTSSTSRSSTAKAPVGEVLQRVGQVLLVDLGEVAEPAEVGAQHRDAGRRAEAQGAEHRPVAAQGEHEVGAVGEPWPRGGAGPTAGSGRRRGPASVDVVLGRPGGDGRDRRR